MWFLVASLYSKEDCLPVCESSILPIDGFYNCWDDCGLCLDGFDLFGNDLVISILLQCKGKGRILVTSVTISTDDFVYGELNTIKLKSPVGALIEFSYVAYNYQNIGQIRIGNLCVFCNLRPYMVNVGHKVTCLFNSIYLGRAQDCITLKNGIRLLSWSPNPIPYEWSISPRTESDFHRLKEEATELALIRMTDVSSFIKKKKLFEEGLQVCDNDMYRNLTFKMPRVFERTDPPIRLQFFNFKYIPPRSIECAVNWSAFERQTQIFERHLVKDIVLRIFYVMDENQVYFFNIRLHCANYEQSLNF